MEQITIFFFKNFFRTFRSRVVTTKKNLQKHFSSPQKHLKQNYIVSEGIFPVPRTIPDIYLKNAKKNPETPELKFLQNQHQQKTIPKK